MRLKTDSTPLSSLLLRRRFGRGRRIDRGHWPRLYLDGRQRIGLLGRGRLNWRHLQRRSRRRRGSLSGRGLDRRRLDRWLLSRRAKVRGARLHSWSDRGWRRIERTRRNGCSGIRRGFGGPRLCGRALIVATARRHVSGAGRLASTLASAALTRASTNSLSSASRGLASAASRGLASVASRGLASVVSRGRFASVAAVAVSGLPGLRGCGCAGGAFAVLRTGWAAEPVVSCCGCPVR